MDSFEKTVGNYKQKRVREKNFFAKEDILKGSKYVYQPNKEICISAAPLQNFKF